MRYVLVLAAFGGVLHWMLTEPAARPIAAGVDAAMIARVLEEPRPVPQSTPAEDPAPIAPESAESSPDNVISGEFFAQLGDAIAAAADGPLVAAAPNAKPTLLLFGAEWCVPCRPAKAMVSDLQASGEVVWAYDWDRDPKAFVRWGVHQMPTWIRLADGVREVGRVPRRGMDEYTDAERDALLLQHPSRPQPLAGSSFGMPSLRLADLSPLVAGRTFQCGPSVTLGVPTNVSWAETTRANSVLLTFASDARPQLRIEKLIRLEPSLVSLEIGPAFVELKTDSLVPFLRTMRLDFDWSSPGERAAPAAMPQSSEGRPVAVQGRRQRAPPDRRDRGPLWDRPLVRLIRITGSVLSICKFFVLIV